MALVIVLTGSSRGIGAATAEVLGGFGAQLVLAGRDRAALAGVARRVEQAGGTALIQAGELTDSGSARQLALAAVREFGRIDVLINNAAVAGEIRHIRGTSLDGWRHLYEVNVLAPLALIQAALPALSASGGRVVNVTSMVAPGPAESIGAYAASKAALSSLTRTLALEEPAVTVLGYQPGPMDTAMMDTIMAGVQEMSPASAAGYRRLAAGGFVDLAVTSAKLARLAARAPHSWTGRVLDHTDPELDQLPG